MARTEAESLGFPTRQIHALYWESNSLGPLAAEVDKAMKASLDQRSWAEGIDENTVLIVTGCDIAPEFFDRPNAYRLQEAIVQNSKARGKTFLRAAVMGDLWFLANHGNHSNVISLGGPAINALSKSISETGNLMKVHSSEKWKIVQSKRMWAVFGNEASDTGAALDAFRHTHLAGYLAQIWPER